MASSRHGSSAGITFAITAERCPQTLLRLLGLFAQQDLIVDHIVAFTSRRSLRATISLSHLDGHRAAILAEKMKQLVMVRTVKVRANR